MDYSINKYNGQRTDDSGVLILTGVHGNEYMPIYMVNKLLGMPELIEKWKQYTNKITIVNGINIDALEQGTRSITFDLNRMFAAEENVLTLPSLINNVIELILTHQTVIDIHSTPCLGTCVILNENTEYTHNFVKFSIRHKIPYVLKESAGPTIKEFVNKNNRIGFTLEISETDDDGIDEGLECLDKIITNINSFSTLKVDTTLPLNKYEILVSKDTGLIYYKKEIGDKVQKHEIICYIKDFNNNIVSEIIAPISGRLIVGPNKKYIIPGDVLFYIQPYNKV